MRPRRLRFVLLDPRAASATRLRTRCPLAGLAVRRHQARGGAPRRRPCAQRGPERRSPLRYFSVYGPRHARTWPAPGSHRRSQAASRFRLYGSGEQSRDFTFVADAVTATVASVRERGFCLQRRRRERGLAERDDCDLRTPELRRLRVVRENAAPGDVRRTAADTRAIRAELGLHPGHSARGGTGSSACLRWHPFQSSPVGMLVPVASGHGGSQTKAARLYSGASGSR